MHRIEAGSCREWTLAMKKESDSRNGGESAGLCDGRQAPAAEEAPLPKTDLRMRH
jgi:hypothetical protein